MITAIRLVSRRVGISAFGESGVGINRIRLRAITLSQDWEARRLVRAGPRHDQCHLDTISELRIKKFNFVSSHLLGSCWDEKRVTRTRVFLVTGRHAEQETQNRKKTQNTNFPQNKKQKKKTKEKRPKTKQNYLHGAAPRAHFS